jgi:hypothetical protein
LGNFFVSLVNGRCRGATEGFRKGKKAKLMMGNFTICMGLSLQTAWAQALRPYKCRFCLLKEFMFVGKTLPNLCKPQ